jgi:antitoxin CptB
MNDLKTRKRRLHYRAWHRGTKEADLLIGGFVASKLETWQDADLLFMETLLEESDVDIMAWALGTQSVPTQYQGPLMHALQRLDYLKKP